MAIAFQEVHRFGMRGNRSAGALSGNVVSEILDSLTSAGNQVFDRISGQKAAADAQQVQLALAQAQAERQAAQTAARGSAWAAFAPSLPYVALGIGALVIGIAVLKK